MSPSERAREFLHDVKIRNGISLRELETLDLRDIAGEVIEFKRRGFLIAEDYDPLGHFLDYHVTRPIQNPAVAYRAETGEWKLIRTTMDHTIYSPKRDELPTVIEEVLPKLTAEIFLLADGSKTLREIYSLVNGSNNENLLEDAEFRTTIDFLTTQDRQLIKFTPDQIQLADPYSAFNIVPRNLYHSDRWHNRDPKSTQPLVDFHLLGIEDADWEFDLIEPTVNHGFRFSHPALGGLDYGSRFCVSTLTPEVVGSLDHSSELNVLEVGGGRGSFAQSFLRQALKLKRVNYHILDLSPELMTSQKKILGEHLLAERHFQQDATSFDLPEHEFDLIISNEVIADFPVAQVERVKTKDGAYEWRGAGAGDVEKYDLRNVDGPDQFLVNAGAFRFLERAWKHLTPGGTLIVTEYGSISQTPARSFHLNHDEYSIHFSNLETVASKIGFKTRLLTLKEFLGIDDDTLVLSGREEHILCLNHVLRNFGLSLPFAVNSKADVDEQCRSLPDEITLTGYSFSPLKTQYHFGPNIKDFFALIMNKPREQSEHA